MHGDDRPVGSILSRRDVVRLLGAMGAAAFMPLEGAASLLADGGQGPAMPGCVVRPEQTEGPYFVDEQLNRSDIRVEPATGVACPGEPLALALTVTSIANGRCEPLPGALVDVWQCDAKGVYSGVDDPNFRTVGQKFLRGVQTTDAAGLARFTTIYPGWYSGRTVHIHFKIRTRAASGAYEFTSQWYFDDALSDRILADARYARPGRRDTYNATDGIYRRGGAQLMLAPERAADRLSATFAIGLDLSDAAAGRSDGRGARGGRGPGRGGRGA
jgi:protocatechuate 3,4-dioxygenase beta subunit